MFDKEEFLDRVNAINWGKYNLGRYYRCHKIPDAFDMALSLAESKEMEKDSLDAYYYFISAVGDKNARKFYSCIGEALFLLIELADRSTDKTTQYCCFHIILNLYNFEADRYSHSPEACSNMEKRVTYIIELYSRINPEFGLVFEDYAH